MSKRLNHAGCLRSLELVCQFFERRLAAREESKDILDRELIESTRLDVTELRQLRRWIERKRYVTAVRYYLSLDTYLRDYIPHRTVDFLWDVGWKQFVTEYADGKQYAKRRKDTPRRRRNRKG
jgi:hypothetical protein